LPPDPHPPENSEEIDEAILDEGCYYLTRMGLTTSEVATRFEISEAEVARRSSTFEKRVLSGGVPDESTSRDFWSSIREEAEGNVKVTFVSKKGFHHSWRSDLRKLDGATLLSLFESSKDFLNLDPSARFLQYETPKNYDPLAMQREISKAVLVIGALLEEKVKEKESLDRKAGPARPRRHRAARPHSPNS
jgi:hypothetical protein